MYMSVKAGAQPATTMAMFICAVSTRSMRLMGPNSCSKVSVSSSVRVLTDSVTSTPLPTAIGVFGMVHWIWMSGGSTDSPSSVANRSWYFLRFQPAAMETTILPGLASSSASGTCTKGGDLVGLDGDDDHVGGRHHFQRIVQRAHAKFGGGLLKLVVVGGTGDHLAAGDHARVDEALGDGLGHVAISDKTDGEVLSHTFSFRACIQSSLIRGSLLP